MADPLNDAVAAMSRAIEHATAMLAGQRGAGPDEVREIQAELARCREAMAIVGAPPDMIWAADETLKLFAQGTAKAPSAGDGVMISGRTEEEDAEAFVNDLVARSEGNVYTDRVGDMIEVGVVDPDGTRVSLAFGKSLVEALGAISRDRRLTDRFSAALASRAAAAWLRQGGGAR